jgi:hypothetical protein
MTDQPNPDPQGGRQPTEEEIRAAYEAQLRQVHVDDVLVQTVLSLLNLGALRAGLTSGGDADRDPEQLRSAIEGIRALLPIVESKLGPDAAPIREALSQLQMAYTRMSGQQATDPSEPGPPPEGEQPKPEGPGPAQSSGRLWVPGQ